LHILDKVNPSAQTKFEKPLRALAETFRRRGIVVLISDLYAPLEDILRSLRQFRSKGNDMVVFQVLDPQEKDFRFTRVFRMEDMETKREVVIVPEEVRADYLERMNQHMQAVKRECGILGIDYLMLHTAQPLDHALYAYLSTRQKSM
jgi:uncharacterized protein (DUF58 family)